MAPNRRTSKTKTARKPKRPRRKTAQEESRKSDSFLEELVKKRTAELRKANDQLQREITERQQAEKELREAKEFSDSLLSSMQDGLCVLDDKGVHIYVNSGLCKMTGFSRDELIGVGPPHPYWPPEEYGEIEKAFQNTLGEQFATFELTFMRKNSERFPVLVSPSSIKDKQGNVVSYFATVKDITERKQAEEEIRKLNEELEQRVVERTTELQATNEQLQVEIAERQRVETERDRLFNLSIDMLCIAGFDGYFKQLNPAWQKTVGWTEEELLSKPYLEFVHPEDREATIGAASDLTINKPALAFQNRYLCKDGSYKWVSWNSFPLTQEKLIFAVVRDITERKQAEEELARHAQQVEQANAELNMLNKELEAFSYSVSHDLRAPLRSMDGFSQILLEDYSQKLDEQGQDYLRRVCAASQRMGQLIDDLLRLSQITRAELTHEKVNLSVLAQRLVAKRREAEPERQVEFVIQEGLEAEGDRQLLRIALGNLLDNAWKFTSKQPIAQIEFGVIGVEGKPAYFVRDNGAGFDMAYVEKLFGAFQRLHSEEEFAGTGIGLAIVQRIIHRHSGEVWAEGEVDEGATFYFTIGERREA